MNIINILNERKQYMPDLQLKEISFGLNKLYIINIQTISDSSQSNKYILDYLSKRSLLKNTVISSLKKYIINYIPSISFIEINESQVYEYLFNGFTILIMSRPNWPKSALSNEGDISFMILSFSVSRFIAY